MLLGCKPETGGNPPKTKNLTMVGVGIDWNFIGCSRSFLQQQNGNTLKFEWIVNNISKKYFDIYEYCICCFQPETLHLQISFLPFKKKGGRGKGKST